MIVTGSLGGTTFEAIRKGRTTSQEILSSSGTWRRCAKKVGLTSIKQKESVEGRRRDKH